MAAAGMSGLPPLSATAWAQCASSDGGQSYTCSGAHTSGQSITSNPAFSGVAVNTQPGFSINTTTGEALRITSTGSASYIDTNASSLTSTANGIVVDSIAGTSATVQTNGTIQSSGHGIWAIGVTDANVTATGTVTATVGVGIQALTYRDLTINAAQVSGRIGIFAENLGTGATSITATGSVTGTRSYGILATHGNPLLNPDGSVSSVGISTATDLTVNAASVTGEVDGIYAHNAGTGATSVTATGQVTGVTDTGIRASNFGNLAAPPGGMTVSAVGVTGGTNGIVVEATGLGPTAVTATGPVTGTSGRGIDVFTNGSGVSVDTTSVTGGTDGIYVRSNATGQMHVTATGPVIGTAGTGIYASASSGTGLTIEATTVTGGYDGISTESGRGVLRVTATGTVTALNGRGILAFGNTHGTDVIVEAATVDGGTHGIAAANFGSGRTQITATGKATGSTYGILAENGPSGFIPPDTWLPSTATDVIVDAVDATGGVGVLAKNMGTGSTRITATDHVAGAGTFGILAVNGSLTYNDDFTIVLTPGGVPVVGATTAVDLTVDAASVSGVNAGIYAYNNGTGTTRVNATGAVSASGFPNSAGLVALNGANARDLTVDTVDAKGDRYGMIIANAGTGAMKIGAGGHVEGGHVGILAINGQFASDILQDAFDISGSPGGTDLTIDANEVSGHFASVYAYNKGTGNTVTTLRGHAEGAVFVYGAPSTRGLSIDVTSVDVLPGSGSYAGILASNLGTGPTVISASGPVSAASTFAGIFAFSGATTKGLQIHAEDAVTGRTYGIVAANTGGEHTYVEAGGHVQGNIGILAINGQVDQNDLRAGNFASTGPSTAKDLVVAAAQVTGGSAGIYAQNHGIGQTSVSAAGAVTAGPAGTGIFAANGTAAAGAATNLKIFASQDVSGFTGITASNYGTSDTLIQTAGFVGGVGGAGIVATNGANARQLAVFTEDVSGTTVGIEARNAGVGETLVGASQVRSSAGTAVTATGRGARLVVAVADATGANGGIAAVNEGTGGTAIASQVAAGGAGHGIDVTNGATATDILIDAGAASGGAGKSGIHVRNNGTGGTLIGTRGLVEGGAAAISAFSAGRPVTIETSGLVRNLSQLSTDIAIEGGGGPVAFTNGGGMVGTVQFGAGAHTMTNDATWNTAAGTSNFGGGKLTNAAGIVIVAAGNSSVTETTTFNGLDTFTNNGILRMTDGGAGDITRQVGGNALFATGSALAVDVDGTGQSDRFVTSGTANIAGAALAVRMHRAASPMAPAIPF